MIKIDRNNKANLGEQLDSFEWKIIEEDESSLGIIDLDLSKVEVKHCLLPGEVSISGEERRRRLQNGGYILLDFQILMALNKNMYLPYLFDKVREEEKKLEHNPWGSPVIYFDGSVFESHVGPATAGLSDPRSQRDPVLGYNPLEDMEHEYPLNIRKYSLVVQKER